MTIGTLDESEASNEDHLLRVALRYCIFIGEMMNHGNSQLSFRAMAEITKIPGSIPPVDHPKILWSTVHTSHTIPGTTEITDLKMLSE